jgi:hypoxanthine phosphoribosyltransferase
LKINREDIEVLYSWNDIRKKAAEMGKEITEFYKDKTDTIYAVCVLKGAIHFFSELVLNIDLDVIYSFVHLSSYSGTSSTGRVKVKSWMEEDMEDKYILLVEDVVDTGLTLRYILRYLRKYHPKDIRIAALAEKSLHDHGINVDFVGFRLEDQFLLGYGLDYEERFRNLPFIGYLKR